MSDSSATSMPASRIEGILLTSTKAHALAKNIRQAIGLATKTSNKTRLLDEFCGVALEADRYLMAFESAVQELLDEIESDRDEVLQACGRDQYELAIASLDALMAIARDGYAITLSIDCRRPIRSLPTLRLISNYLDLIGAGVEGVIGYFDGA
ncbi:MAG: hypothetical protein RLY93_12315 [Sumerlaeia bacterium]